MPSISSVEPADAPRASLDADDDLDPAWLALDDLLHGATDPVPSGDGREPARSRNEPRGDPRTERPSVDDARWREGNTGLTLVGRSDHLRQARLRPADLWPVIVAAEDARVRRHGRPTTAVQIEVRGIAAIAERCGDPAAARVFAILGRVLAEQTRSSDLYARTSEWRVAGLLPETGPEGASAYVDRLRRAHDAAAGPSLPLGLAIGAVTASTTSLPSVALERALAAMHGDRRSGADPSVRRADRDPSTRPVGPIVAGSVIAAIRELDELRREGLVDAVEYGEKRAEILGRL